MAQPSLSIDLFIITEISYSAHDCVIHILLYYIVQPHENVPGLSSWHFTIAIISLDAYTSCPTGYDVCHVLLQYMSSDYVY